MTETTELVFMLEKAVHNLLSSAQEAARHPTSGARVTAGLYEASAGLRNTVEAIRGAPRANSTDTAPQALRRLGTALDGLRPYLPRGSAGGEPLALARWLCDTALSSMEKKEAGPPGA